MKKYLLPEKGNFYKANLHCHSTLSDGELTVEEIKTEYLSKGYSVVAFTDHDIFLTHNDLTDDNFLALNGFEIEVNEVGRSVFNDRKTCHFCLVALSENMKIQPMWNEKYLFGHAVEHKDEVVYDKNKAPFERAYTGECISEMMKNGADEGFFVTYNHPTWSLESYPEYIGYNNMHAFEMFNGSCLAGGFDDYNPRVYDDLLCAGKRIFCIGADDNHNQRAKNTRHWDSGVAFTVIIADELKYSSIANALKNGDFYSSEGPQIKSLWFEDGTVHIECSDADRIVMTCGRRKARVQYAENGELLTSAEFKVNEADGYIRFTVIDKSGNHACTNAYFTDELF